MTPGTRGTRLAPWAFALAGILLSLWHGGRPSVWFDELATASAVDRTPGELWDLLGNIDAVHGLYYWGVRTFSLVFGLDATALRAFSALGVGAATAACYVLARRLGDDTFALVAGFIALILPRLTWAGVEARSYSWVIAAAALVLIAGHRAAESTPGPGAGRHGSPTAPPCCSRRCCSSIPRPWPSPSWRRSPGLPRRTVGPASSTPRSPRAPRS